VREAREDRNLSQAQFAALCEITPRHLRNVEFGTAKASNRLYLHISKLLGIDAGPVLRRAA
jgi:transcriptional regulator with XRE-family HTH domain